MTIVSLHPEQRRNQETPLDQQISRVTREHGSFANLDEHTLETNDTAMDVDSTPEKEAKAAEDPTAERSTADLRRDLSTKLATALNEAALNLDFVSLLVSSSRPQVGNSSISPMLRSQVPNGSLNANTIATPAPTIPSRAGYGWKVKKYTESALALEEAAERLRGESRMEATFWQSLLSATSSGEVINRKLQIKYGYRDSGSGYADRGIGKIVRERHTGEPIFKPGIANPVKLVQVSIFAYQNLEPTENTGSYSNTPEPERLLGMAVVPYEFSLEPLGNLLRSIRQERGTLFELELMQQLIQEARWDLGSHRVKLVEGGKVVCELFGGRIEIELVEDIPPTVPGDAFNIAQAVNYSLHLLLVNQFHKRLERSHSHPPPLSTQQAPAAATEWKILRPVLAHVQHGILVSRILKLIHVLLPQAKTEHHKFEPAHLSDEPTCNITVQTSDPGAMTLEVRSPFTDSNKPLVTVLKDGKRTKILDLTELEVLLKWAASTSEKPAEA